MEHKVTVMRTFGGHRLFFYIEIKENGTVVTKPDHQEYILFWKSYTDYQTTNSIRSLKQNMKSILCKNQVGVIVPLILMAVPYHYQLVS